MLETLNVIFGGKNDILVCCEYPQRWGDFER